ncbi:MAG: hypothetical protein JXB36_17805, partial [Gammaproteobacteria bacterium]|nr:hypothetical protein [Gammaproteobacteria bacterium]
ELSNEDLVEELRRIATELGAESLTQRQFKDRSKVSAACLSRRFGSWTAALAAAGLEPVAMGRRYDDEDYFENLLTVEQRHPLSRTSRRS